MICCLNFFYEYICYDTLSLLFTFDMHFKYYENLVRIFPLFKNLFVCEYIKNCKKFCKEKIKQVKSLEVSAYFDQTQRQF